MEAQRQEFTSDTKRKMSARPQDKGQEKADRTIESGTCDIIPFGQAREFYLSLRHSLIMQLAALDKLLGTKRKCKHCGNES